MERGTMRVKCLFQEHNKNVPLPGLEPGLPDPESNVLGIFIVIFAVPYECKPEFS